MQLEIFAMFATHLAMDRGVGGKGFASMPKGFDDREPKAFDDRREQDARAVLVSVMQFDVGEVMKDPQPSIEFWVILDSFHQIIAQRAAAAGKAQLQVRIRPPEHIKCVEGLFMVLARIKASHHQIRSLFVGGFE